MRGNQSVQRTLWLCTMHSTASAGPRQVYSRCAICPHSSSCRMSSFTYVCVCSFIINHQLETLPYHHLSSLDFCHPLFIFFSFVCHLLAYSDVMWMGVIDKNTNWGNLILISAVPNFLSFHKEVAKNQSVCIYNN